MKGWGKRRKRRSRRKRKKKKVTKLIHSPSPAVMTHGRGNAHEKA